MATIQSRAAADGSVNYRAIVRLKGFPQQSATFKRKTDAKRWIQSTESALREGRYFLTAEAKKHTLAELIDRYVEHVAPTKKNPRRREQMLGWWKEQLGDYALAHLTPALLAEQRDKLGAEDTRRRSRRKPATVVRYMAVLSHAFTVAVKEWGWLDENPMKKVTKPSEPRGRVRFLDDAERARLLEVTKASSDPNLYTLVVIALSTGMRQGEILQLTWSAVDLKRSRVTLENTKNGDRRVVPLVGPAKALLAERSKVRSIRDGYVFPSPSTGRPRFPRHAWDRALDDAGIDDFRFHDLRHCAASYLAMNGASMMEIADVLGHRTLQMVRRYAHLSEAHTHGVVAAMNEKIFGS